ncbi:DUF5033 domain-containing protein [Bacteroides helcogenes]|uniref:DUF5033 domain-containing protein n=1 Tax=Bacteroides helcogenes (strain ATCC 35417 / DSM 20613 / JCM 6297 / CCUG 15421 / P 36-108) TaxID=693979 RepID=E6SPQ8_BACT6|nr:DUF5033 domain-containing protein [Bacteroides helcogenes]ADV43899.1 hypothetical protein Bache_1921 [Bacteroides helcogenes P 36-108]MDY5237525.1 DUF5033 domain-containing protein [Bacteroides helcogenes]
MKTFYSLVYSFMLLLMMNGLTACSASSDEAMAEQTQTSGFATVMSTYGAEYATLNVSDLKNVPSVLTEDMRGVLEALKQNSTASYDCARVSDKSFEKVVMTGNYKSATRGGSDGFALNVELKFSFEKGQVYYWGTDYSYSSTLFDWSAQGLSLSPVNGGDGYTYQFESETYLYFKVSDQAGTVVKVPIIFKGNYNFSTEKGTYSFQLLKYSK